MLAAVLTGSALLSVVVGCGSTAPTAPTDPLPPRPSEVRLDGLDPCALAPAKVLLEARLPDTPKVMPALAPGIRQCVWARGASQSPSGSLGITTATQQDVRNVLSVRGAEIISIAGFGAVTLWDNQAGAETNCDVRIDVAPGQGLWVTYENILGDESGATHALMCERAQRAAEGIMQRLLATAK